jgi:hypothetical protein
MSRSAVTVARRVWVLGLAVLVLACGGDHAAPEKSLPCDVERVLVERCQGCHGEPQRFGAPMPLVTWDDLHARVGGDTKRRVYELISKHIHGKESLMPPPPNAALTETELALLDDWLADDAPASKGEACEDTDAGIRDVPGAVYGKSSEPPSDCEDFYEFHAHAEGSDKDDKPFEIAADLGNGQNAYTCFYFAPPYAEDAKALWLHSLVDNERVLHHWILYGTDQATHTPGTVAPCSAAQAGAYFIAGWAPGGGDFVLPSNVEMDLPTGPKAGLILEVHYFNPDKSPTQDHSGVRLCTAKQNTRENLASVHFTGSEGICLKPGQKRTISGVCDPRDDMGDVHIVGVWPHMHKLGRHMKVTIQRKDGASETVHDEIFDFSSQIYFPQPENRWVLHPGDTLKTECVYENDTAGQVHFGERTQDEK